MNHHANARWALTEARRILDRRPPRRVAHRALALDRADTLIALARTHILAAHAGLNQPVANTNGDSLTTWLQDTPYAAPNDQNDVSTEGTADLIRGTRAALRTTEAERDQALAETAALRMQLRNAQYRDHAIAQTAARTDGITQGATA
jgi:hypothetical protein